MKKVILFFSLYYGSAVLTGITIAVYQTFFI